jgi:hypothetical protein
MIFFSYLRAYMAGIAAPTPLLLVALTPFLVARFVYNIPVPVERVIIFPMAIIPNLFGVWNMLYLASRARTRLPLDSWCDTALHHRPGGIPSGPQPQHFGCDAPWSRLFRCGGDPLCISRNGVSSRADCLLPGLEVPDRFFQSDCRGRKRANERAS